ncbi:MAG TPA: DUF2891 family protein [Ornithinicoccus sp.]|nr:DUF2891 family protein [Ornithinicoccus sp.]
MTTSISDLARQHAPAWARVAREVLDTPYPYASGHVALGPDDTDVTPHRLHPAFHGALDWHSSVHMQWSLLTLLDRYDEALAEAGEAGPALRMLCSRLTEARLAAEVDYLWSRPAFERPYGWAWAAMLVAAAYRSERAESTGWAIALEPLGEVIAQHTVDWLPRQVYPVRHGKHQNDAFALALLLQAFGELGREDVVAAVRRRALEWFGHDTSYDTRTEPSGTDFLSPALCEAELMRRVLPAGEFRAWLAGFLPGLGEGAHPQLLGVPEIRDATDGQLVHLAGLGLSRAWQLRQLAPHLEPAAAEVVLGAADKQVEAMLPLITEGDFMATHWLVSFALLATGHAG